MLEYAPKINHAPFILSFAADAKLYGENGTKKQALIHLYRHF